MGPALLTAAAVLVVWLWGADAPARIGRVHPPYAKPTDEDRVQGQPPRKTAEVQEAKSGAPRATATAGTTLAGTVLRADGNRIHGARVWITGPDFRKRTVADKGRFRVVDLRPGTYSVHVRASKHWNTPTENVSVRIDPGDIRLELKILVPDAAISYLNVLLVDASNRPLSGWHVEGGWHRNFHRAWTGPDGRAQLKLECLPGAAVWMHCKPPERHEGRTSFRQLCWARATKGAPPVRIVVPDVVPVTFVVTDEEGTPVTQRVRINAGDRCDPPGTPGHVQTYILHRGERRDLEIEADGFVTAWWPEWNPPPRGGRIPVRMRRAGRIRARIRNADGSVPKDVYLGLWGSYRPLKRGGVFEHRPVGLGPFVLYLGPRRGLPTLRKELEIQSGKTVDLGEVRLPPPARLRGTVVDAEGRPVPGAYIVFDARTPGMRGRTGKADPRGSFEVAIPPFEKGVVFASRFPRDRGDIVRTLWFDRATAEVVNPAQRVKLTMERSSTVELTVRLIPALAGRGYTVDLGVPLTGGGTHWSYLDYVHGESPKLIQLPVSPGRFHLRAQTSEGHVAETELTTKPGEHHRVTLVLR